MKSVQIVKPFEVCVNDIPMPSVSAGQVLVRLEYVGFCGSDLNTFRGANGMVTYPRIPGHEIGGVIEAAGEGVPEHLKPGMTVTVNPYTACGHCASCRRGRYNACEHNETLGVQRDGAMCGYVALPWEKVLPCPGITTRDAALIEPMSVGFHAVNRGRVSEGDVVMVIGCGMVGLGAVAGAVRRGAVVVAADLDDGKLELARDLGAEYVYNTSAPWPYDFDPDVVIEAVGAVPTYRLAVERVAFTGRIVCIGYAKSDVPLTTSLFVKKELDIMGSRNAEPQDFEAVTEFVRGHDVSRFISGIVKPEGARKALEDWNAAPGKVFRILVEFKPES